RAPRRRDIDHAVEGGQAAGVDHHGAAALVDEGDVVVQDVQVARGVVVIGTVEGEVVGAGGEDVDLVEPGRGVGVSDRPAQRAGAGGVAVDEAGHAEDRRGQ